METTATGYENAPATTLVATDCACCSRPLVDAPSVERGVGPTCAKKYGYKDAQGPADFGAAAAHAARAGVALASETDARRAANALVYRIAALQGDVETPHLIAAVAALGWSKLAAACAENLAPVHVAVTVEDATMVIEAPYSPTLTEALRAIPGRRWDAVRKVNTVPAARRGALWTALKGALPEGAVVSGPRGMVVIHTTH